MRNRILSILFVAVVLLSSSMSGAFARDWEKYPAFVEIPRVERVGVVGDIHGAFAEFANSVSCLGFCASVATNTFTLTWTGGKNVLVFIGDYGDRGKYTKQVYDAVIDLEEQAEKAGGKVIALLGNHEIMLLNGTIENRARNARDYDYPRTAIDTVRSFEKGGVNFYKAISPKGKYGAWIRNRPLFAKVNGFLFVHAGPGYPLETLEEMARRYRIAMDRKLYTWERSIMIEEWGPMWTRNWWQLTDKNIAKDDDLAQLACEKYGVRGIFFGHTPGAMGMDGWLNQKYGKLVSVDIGMTPFYRHSQGGGALLALEPTGKVVVNAHYPDKPTTFLFSQDFEEGPLSKGPVSGLSNSAANITVDLGEKKGAVELVVTDLQAQSFRAHPISSSENARLATFNLTNLAPNTKYFYRVELDGNYQAGMRGSFKTLP